MTIYRMKMTIIQYRSCWDDMTVTGRPSPEWPCVGVNLGHDAPSPGLYHGEIREVMLLILTHYMAIRILCIKRQIMY